MTAHNASLLLPLIQADADSILAEWLTEFRSAASDRQAATEARAVLAAFTRGLEAGGGDVDFAAGPWEPLRDALAQLSASRAAQGSSSAETSRFVLALKKPLFQRLQQQIKDPVRLGDTLWWLTSIVDQAAQHTVGTYQSTREEIIRRQQQELLELSTPVVKLWDGVLAVPMIGTLDSARTQLVMEELLQRIVDSASELAIIDITGVPTVDTLVAQHLLKTVTAIRLMGADCIISGIRPQIAQTIVHLGIDLHGIVTKATLADALALALKRTGHVVSRPAGKA